MSVKNSHKHNCIWYLIAGDGGQLATTTCFGHHGGRRQVVHTKVDNLIQYANTYILMPRHQTVCICILY